MRQVPWQARDGTARCAHESTSRRGAGGQGAGTAESKEAVSAAYAIVVFAPSPLVGEGSGLWQQGKLGEGRSDTNPSPNLVRCDTLLPSPARGEGDLMH